MLDDLNFLEAVRSRTKAVRFWTLFPVNGFRFLRRTYWYHFCIHIKVDEIYFFLLNEILRFELQDFRDE